MYFATTQPEALSSADGNLRGIGEDAHITAHAHLYQAVSAQAAPIHELFVSTLSAGGDSSATTEAANAVAAG
jgi:PE family